MTFPGEAQRSAPGRLHRDGAGLPSASEQPTFQAYSDAAAAVAARGQQSAWEGVHMSEAEKVETAERRKCQRFVAKRRGEYCFFAVIDGQRLPLVDLSLDGFAIPASSPPPSDRSFEFVLQRTDVPDEISGRARVVNYLSSADGGQAGCLVRRPGRGWTVATRRLAHRPRSRECLGADLRKGRSAYRLGAVAGLRRVIPVAPMPLARAAEAHCRVLLRLDAVSPSRICRVPWAHFAAHRDCRGLSVPAIRSHIRPRDPGRRPRAIGLWWNPRSNA
jgi:hypothetical protein